MSEELLENARALYRAGQLGEAAGLYHEVLRGNPRHFEALSSLAGLYFGRSQFDKAEYLAGEALKLDPFHIGSLTIRGLSYLRLKRYEKALASFDTVLILQPGLVDAIANRATVLLEMGRLEEAIAAFDAALALEPTHAVSWNNRGNALHMLSRNEEAVDSYERALAVAPEFEDARRNRLYALGALKRGAPGFAEVLHAQALDAMRREKWQEAEARFNEVLTHDPEHPDARVQLKKAAITGKSQEFDHFAPNFEKHLASLEYRVPEYLRELAQQVAPGARAPLDILDLGCGTGLVGNAFSDLAQGGRLDGVDLSTQMMELARKRGIYTELAREDLESVLARTDRTYDFVVCADTLIYLGDLAGVFSGAFRVLRPGGLFFFGVESKDGEGWDFSTATCRYRHSAAYLEAEAARAGFVFAGRMDRALRLERSEPVPGFEIALRKPAS